MNEVVMNLLNSEDYKERMKGEYLFIKDKYENLHRTIVKYDAGTLGFDLTCSIGLLRDQAAAMGQYLYLLEVRAQIEGVELQ